MTLRLLLAVFAAVLLAGADRCPSWRTVEPGVAYREYQRDGLHAYVVRVDLRREELAVAVTDEAEKGTVVSDFAKRAEAIVAINGDYFDPEMRPVGHTRGPAGSWQERSGTRNQPIVGFARGRAEIFRVASRESPLPEWVDQAISGWPVVIQGCRALDAQELPGSDFFTRAPHPRTAIGFSEDGETMFLVVADGRREGVPGPTLAELGSFMREELKVCEALNLDGGGSSTLVLEGAVMNRPSDGGERVVANHLGIVRAAEAAAAP